MTEKRPLYLLLVALGVIGAIALRGVRRGCLSTQSAGYRFRINVLVLFASSMFAITAEGSDVFTFDFNDGLPPGTATYGNAQVLFDGSGVLQLTENASDQYGQLVIQLFESPVTSFVARFQMRISDSTCCGDPSSPNGVADGISFNFSSIIPNPPTYGNPGEEGLPDGVSVCFDTWDNTYGSFEAPAIDVKFNGNLVGINPIQPYTGPRFVDVLIALAPDGSLDVNFDGLTVFQDLPTGHVATVGAQFVFAARTGGANARHLIDNLEITTNPIPEPTAWVLAAAAAGIASAFTIRGRRGAG